MEWEKYYEELHKKILIIGVGEFGCNVVAQMQCNPVDITKRNNSKGVHEVSYVNPSYLTVLNINDFVQNDMVELIKNNDVYMVFVVCGMDGVTETDAAPVITETSKKLGVLTIGIVTNTLPFESQICMDQAMSRIKKLRENADTIIVIPNEKLEDNKLDSGVQLIRKADEVCVQTIESFLRMFFGSGTMGFDFMDVSDMMKSQGVASIARVGIGICNNGEEMIDGAKAIVSGLLSDVNWKEVSYVSINVDAGVDRGHLELIDMWNYIDNLAGIKEDDYNRSLGTMQVEYPINDNVRATKITLIIGQQ